MARIESQPEGVEIRRTVDNAGNITLVENGEGGKTLYEYDGLNRVTLIDPPIGASTNVEYTNKTASSERGGLVEETTFDEFGWPERKVLGGVIVDYKYDIYGRKVYESQPYTSSPVGSTSYEYDIFNRLKNITYPDGETESREYNGNMVDVRKPNGNRVQYSYRSYGDPDKKKLIRVRSLSSSGMVVNDISRDYDGLITAIVTTVSGKTLERRYTYNENKRLVGIFEPELGNISLGRDERGNLTSYSVNDSLVSEIEYDQRDRPVETVFSDGQVVKQVYDQNDRLISSTSSIPNSNALVARSFLYDENGNLLEDSIDVDGITLKAQYSYNHRDQLSSIKYPISGEVVSYFPDILGRPTKVSGYIESVQYWPSGAMKEIRYENGVVTSYQQNSRLWPSDFKTSKDGGVYLQQKYEYDAAGNLLFLTDFLDPSKNISFSYDQMSRLVSMSRSEGDGFINYDGFGNITSMNIPSVKSINYTYNEKNLLQSVSGTYNKVFEYDLLGNVSKRNADVFQYSAASNLICAKCNRPSEKIEYVYDGSNSRVSVKAGGLRVYEFWDQSNKLLTNYTPGTPGDVVQHIYLGGRKIASKAIN